MVLSWLRSLPGEMGEAEAVEEDGTVGFVEKGKPFEGIGSE